VPFFYAQPAAGLVDGITAPTLAGPGGAVSLDAWPKSTREVVEALGARAAKRAR
jgi:hypothetical protein